MYFVEEETRKKVCEMMGKTEQEADRDVDTIREWMKTQKHLPEIMEDVKIRNFLQLNKFQVEKTKGKIDEYYTIRSKIPDLFENMNPKLPHMQRLFELMYFFTHPKTLDGIHRVYFSKLKTPNTFAAVEMTALTLQVFEIRLKEDCMVDDILIMDMENFGFRDILRYSPRLIMRFLSVYKNVFSLRLKGCYFLNSPFYITMWTKILKFVLPEKLYNRIHVHGDAEVLKELFAKEDLPKDYGGDGLSLEELTEMLKLKFAEHQDRFDELDKLRVNEGLRPKKK